MWEGKRRFTGKLYWGFSYAGEGTSLGIFPGGQQASCGISECRRGDELLQYTLVAADARRYSHWLSTAALLTSGITKPTTCIISTKEREIVPSAHSRHIARQHLQPRAQQAGQGRVLREHPCLVVLSTRASTLGSAFPPLLTGAGEQGVTKCVYKGTIKVQLRISLQGQRTEVTLADDSVVADSPELML